MTDRPIIFSAPMVRAILEGRKTQTRRIIKAPRWSDGEIEIQDDGPYAVATKTGCLSKVPVHYTVGDLLWVREAFGFGVSDHGECPRYRATMDYQCGDKIKSEHEGPFKWRPSIHMPRRFSRITLEVTGVKVERLQSISEDDAKAEGITPLPSGRYFCGFDEDGEITAKSPVTAFGWLWNSIHGPDGWAANPWVAAVTFRRVE